MHNQDKMALLWSPESWSQRLAELEAQSGELKEAPLRRDVRSLGILLGVVLCVLVGVVLVSFFVLLFVCVFVFFCFLLVLVLWM